MIIYGCGKAGIIHREKQPEYDPGKECHRRPSRKWQQTYERALKQMQEDENDRRHGTKYGYRCGCRCQRCREAAGYKTQRHFKDGREKRRGA